MATAKHVLLCQMVEAYLNVQTVIPFTFNVVRQNVIHQDLADTASTTVAVTPGLKALGADVEANTREGILKQYQVRLHILNYIEQGLSEEDDALLLLESLEDAMVYRDMGDFAFLNFTSDASPEPPFDVTLQQDSAFFYGLVTVEYLGT